MTRHDKFLLRSADEAAESQMEIKHGAVLQVMLQVTLVRGNKVVGSTTLIRPVRVLPGEYCMVCVCVVA